MYVNIPICILNTFITWYCKLSTYVPRAGVLQQFGVCSDVMKGSLISPLIFSLCINDLISLIMSEGYSCCLDNIYAGCLLFPDDLMLLSTLVRQLSVYVLNVCYQCCCYWNS